MEIKIEPGMNLSRLMDSFCSGWSKRPKTITTIDGERAKVISEVMRINNEHNRLGQIAREGRALCNVRIVGQKQDLARWVALTELDRATPTEQDIQEALAEYNAQNHDTHLSGN